MTNLCVGRPLRHVGTPVAAVPPTIDPVGARNQVEGAAFADAVDEIVNATLRPEVIVDVIPAPQRIAPFAHAISGDVASPNGDELGTGRFILLHDPAGNDAWDGTFRCVTFARADIEAEMAADPSLPSVGWTWLTDALQANHADYHAFSGSVTVVHTGIADIAPYTREADILVAAAGSPHLIKADMVKPGAVVVAAGVTFEGKKIVSDVDDDVAEVASWLSPMMYDLPADVPVDEKNSSCRSNSASLLAWAASTVAMVVTSWLRMVNGRVTSPLSDSC